MFCMIDSTFIIQNADDFGRLMLFRWLRDNNYSCFWENGVYKYGGSSDKCVYFGDVTWTEEKLGKKFRPDYYPEFLSSYFYRKIWKPTDEYFVKPADRYKRFDGTLVTEGRLLGDIICSEVVNFTDEWRYYVANREVFAAEWYKGADDKEKPAPELDTNVFPSDYVGVVDMGRLDNGKFALVEAHHPYGFGLYSKDYQKMAEFIEIGWKYLKEI